MPLKLKFLQTTEDRGICLFAVDCMPSMTYLPKHGTHLQNDPILQLMGFGL
jgi:hypothetical protein